MSRLLSPGPQTRDPALTLEFGKEVLFYNQAKITCLFEWGSGWWVNQFNFYFWLVFDSIAIETEHELLYYERSATEIICPEL